MQEKQRILVADDDAQIREVVRILLESEGYEVVEAADGQEAIRLAGGDIDLMILDIMMPGASGFSACAQIRKQSQAPVIFLSAKSQDSDKTMGFSVGGDDYLAKPFSASELIARVKAALRRYLVYGAKPQTPAGTLHFSDIMIDLEKNRVLKAGSEVFLTDIEYGILLLLAKNRKKVFSVQNIYESVWQEPYFYSANNTVMVHMRNIRKKIGDSTQNSEIIRTVWGRGYRID
jgi:DNA-binding response OmpR family regulator